MNYTAININPLLGAIPLAFNLAGISDFYSFDSFYNKDYTITQAEVLRDILNLNFEAHRFIESSLNALEIKKFLKEFNKTKIHNLSLNLITNNINVHSRYTTEKKVYENIETLNTILDIIKKIEIDTILIDCHHRFKRYKYHNDFISELRTIYHFLDTETLDVSYFGVPQISKRYLIMGSRLGNIKIKRKREKQIPLKDVLIEELSEFEDEYFNNQNPAYLPEVLERIKLIPPDGTMEDIPTQYWLACYRNKGRVFGDAYGRLSINKPSVTITSNYYKPASGRYIHPFKDRTITHREALLLHSFPFDYKLLNGISINNFSKILSLDSSPVFIQKQLKVITEHLNLYY